jgi:hypothetical protein
MQTKGTLHCLLHSSDETGGKSPVSILSCGETTENVSIAFRHLNKSLFSEQSVDKRRKLIRQLFKVNHCFGAEVRKEKS